MTYESRNTKAVDVLIAETRVQMETVVPSIEKLVNEDSQYINEFDMTRKKFKYFDYHHSDLKYS